MPSADGSDTPATGSAKRTVHNWRQLEIPLVEHDFDGEPDVLNLTFDRRLELRKVLESMFTDVRKSTGRTVQVTADVKIRLGGPAKEHVYNVTLTDKAFDAAAFQKELPQSTNALKRKAPSTNVPETSSSRQQAQGDSDALPGRTSSASGEQAVVTASSSRAPAESPAIAGASSSSSTVANGQSAERPANGTSPRPATESASATSALGMTPLKQANSTEAVPASLKFFVNTSLGKLAPPVESAEERAAKRARTDGTVTIDLSNEDDQQYALQQAVAVLKRQGSESEVEKLNRFIKDWHTQWTQQGSWLFDNITRLVNAPAHAGGPPPPSMTPGLLNIERRIDHVQEVLGQSINTASSFVMAELANANRMLPWIGDCRKTGANKVQERDDAWRSKIAAFHDAARTDRAAAEKRIEERLGQQQRMIEQQHALLTKLLHANDIDADAEDKVSEGTDEREESLGAQLTRELDEQERREREAAKAKSAAEPITVDDET